MMSRLQSLAQRRALLVADIQRERSICRSTFTAIRQDLAYAGLGLMAGQLLTRIAWMRTITLTVLGLATVIRLKKSNL